MRKWPALDLHHLTTWRLLSCSEFNTWSECWRWEEERGEFKVFPCCMAEGGSVPHAYLHPGQGLWIPSLQKGTRQYFRAPVCSAHRWEKLALNVKRQITAGIKQQPNKNLHSYENYVIGDAICHLLYNRAYILKQAGNSISFTSSLSYSTSVIESKQQSHPLHEFLKLKCSPEDCYPAAVWCSLEACMYQIKENSMNQSCETWYWAI